MQPNRPASQNRRARPAKPALTRQGIVDAALEILHAEGLKKVTMRRIATALDTGAASLYVYIHDTEDLHAQILDALLASITAKRTKGTWREKLKTLLGRYMDVLFTRPEIAQMAISTLPSGPNYLALGNAILGLLQEGGVPDRDAAWAVDLLLLYATANAVEHGDWKESARKADEFSALTKAVTTADARTYPNIARLSDELMSGGPERIQWGLDVIIAGVLATPRPAIKKERL